MFWSSLLILVLSLSEYNCTYVNDLVKPTETHNNIDKSGFEKSLILFYNPINAKYGALTYSLLFL